MAKTNKVAAAIKPKNGAFNSLLLAWVLSFLAIPTVMSMVPALFDTDEYSNTGETIWYFVWQSVWQSIIVFFFATLLVSYTITLILNHQTISRMSLKAVSRSAFIIATVLNVAIVVGFLIFAYLLPLFGFTL
jgi:hypothetical protein